MRLEINHGICKRASEEHCDEYASNVLDEQGVLIAKSICEDFSEKGIIESEHTAILIVDAINTYQKTGLLPSDMANSIESYLLTISKIQSEIEDLKEALQEALPELKETLADVGHDPSVVIDNSKLIQTINKCEKALSGKESRKEESNG